MELRFLGTSSSQSLPRPGDNCSQCRSKDPPDKRLRSSLLVDGEILFEAGPDLEGQLSAISLQPSVIKTVLITHHHADADGSLGWLRKNNPEISVVEPETDKLPAKIGDYDLQAIEVGHAQEVKTLAYWLNGLLYATDFLDIRPLIKHLKEVRVAVLDGSMLSRDFGGHMAIKRQLAVLKKEGLPKLGQRYYYSHNGHTNLPHEKLEKVLQGIGGPQILIAFDSLKIRVRGLDRR